MLLFHLARSMPRFSPTPAGRGGGVTSGGCCGCWGCKVMMALPPCSSTVPTTFMAMVLVKGVRFAENPMALGSGIKDCNLLGEIAIFEVQDPRSKI